MPAPSRWFDGLRLVGWAENGYLHTAIRGSAVAGIFSAGWVLALSALLLAQPINVARRNARYYLTPKRDAVMAVVDTRQGWKIDDHLTL